MLIFAQFFTYSVGYSFNKNLISQYKTTVSLYITDIPSMIENKKTIGGEDGLYHIYEKFTN